MLHRLVRSLGGRPCGRHGQGFAAANGLGLAAGLLLALVCLPSVQADTYELSSGIQIDLLPMWRASVKNGELSGHNADKTLVLFSLPGSGTVENTVNNFATILGQVGSLERVDATRKSAPEDINELPQTWITGTAGFKDEGKAEFADAKWLATVVDVDGRPVILAAVGNVTGNDFLIQAAFRSIKRIDHSAVAVIKGTFLRFLGIVSPFVTITNILGGFLVVVVILGFGGKVPIGYNLRNLSIRWKTTLLTALAFTLVVSLLTVMMAFVNAMFRMTDESGNPSNVMILADGATDENFSTLVYSDTGDILLHPGIARDEQQEPLCSREVYIVVNQPVEVAAGEPARRRFIQLRGMEKPAIAGRVHGLELKDGRWFSSAGVQAVAGQPGTGAPAPAIEAVLGQGMAAQLGHDHGKEEMRVGDLFNLGDRQWIVVGVMRSSGSTFDSEVWAKQEQVGPMFGKTNFSSIVARAANPAAARALAADLTTGYKKAAVQAQVETEYFARLSETNRVFLYAIILVAVTMGIGGVFGVMNTMFAAISQRKKDIGVLRILGFQRWQVLFSFLLESLAIAMIGGALGCAVGSLANGWSATSIVSSGQGGGKTVVLRLFVDAKIIATGLALALGMGLLGGLVPALSAMRLRPLESMR